MRTTIRITVKSESHSEAKDLVAEEAKRILNDLPFEIQSMAGESFDGVMTWEAVVVTTDPFARPMSPGIPQHLLDRAAGFTPTLAPVDDSPYGRLKRDFEAGTGHFEGKPE